MPRCCSLSRWGPPGEGLQQSDPAAPTYAATASPSQSIAACTPPLPCGRPSAIRPVSTADKVPRIIGALRIAHMGHVNAPMILGTLSVIEVALNALEIPHGKGGAQAAIDWLGAEVKA